MNLWRSQFWARSRDTLPHARLRLPHSLSAVSPTSLPLAFRSEASVRWRPAASRTWRGSASAPCWPAPWQIIWRRRLPDFCLPKRALDFSMMKHTLASGGRRSVPGYPEAIKALQYLRRRLDVQPRVGIILGSGLGELVARLREQKRIPYRSIPHFPRSTVAGHAGELHTGLWGRVPVAILAGRMHLYEGYTPAEVVFPTRVLALLGIETVIVICAAGGIAPQAVPGSFMVFSDHINGQGNNPLVGAPEPHWGERFIDMS